MRRDTPSDRTPKLFTETDVRQKKSVDRYQYGPALTYITGYARLVSTSSRVSTLVEM
jgi:hypothetical protein